MGLAVGVLAVMFSSLPILGQRDALAGTPSLKEVRGRQATEIKLPVKYRKYAKKKVRIKLYITNVYTGEQWTTGHNRKLDKDGRVNLRVDNLTPGTLYRFKVKIKKQNGGKYSHKSESRKGSTRF